MAQKTDQCWSKNSKITQTWHSKFADQTVFCNSAQKIYYQHCSKEILLALLKGYSVRMAQKTYCQHCSKEILSALLRRHIVSTVQKKYCHHCPKETLSALLRRHIGSFAQNIVENIWVIRAEVMSTRKTVGK